jgi:hypothetical protein
MATTPLTTQGHQLATALSRCAIQMGNPQINCLIAKSGWQICDDMVSRFQTLSPGYAGLPTLRTIRGDMLDHDNMALNHPWLVVQSANGNNLAAIVTDLETAEP